MRGGMSGRDAHFPTDAEHEIEQVDVLHAHPMLLLGNMIQGCAQKSRTRAGDQMLLPPCGRRGRDVH
jgi:hypothetical protein